MRAERRAKGRLPKLAASILDQGRDVGNWTVLCDFDGTISVEDVIDSLLVRFGEPGWETLERDWRAGRIGSRECLRGQIALLQMRREELDAHLGELWIDPAFPAFHAALRLRGIPLRVVSDGLDYAIHNILARFGMDELDVVANALQPTADARRWRLASPFGADGCTSGTCKCAIARMAREQGRKVLLVGDGVSDFCVADRADFVFAKHRLIEHCRAAGIPYVPVTGFAEALEWLPRLLHGDLEHSHALLETLHAD